jgi:ADP-heptose:LPS heptosyltransferase
VGPESTTPAKRWNRAGFESIGRHLVASGWYPVAVGGANGFTAAATLVEAWRGGAAAWGSTLEEVAALLSVCRAYVGVDSGLAHLAAAVGTRCAVIAGGHARPGQWDPLGEGHSILRHAMPCEGCGLSTCPVEGHPCMQRVLPDDVLEVVRRVLSASQL